MSSRKLSFFAIVLPLTISCAQHTANFRTLDPVPLELMCSFAEKTQMFETSVVLQEKQLTGNLEVYDLRHKFLVEKIRGPVAREDGFWILRSIDKSDSVTTSREHRINQATLAYERKSFVQMGDTQPLTIFNRGQCPPSWHFFRTLLHSPKSGRQAPIPRVFRQYRPLAPKDTDYYLTTETKIGFE